MYQIIVTGTRWFNAHSILINNIETWKGAEAIAKGLAIHLQEVGFRKVTFSIIAREGNTQ